MTAPKEPLFFRVKKDGKIVEVKQFTGEQVVIGREGNIDLLINDSSISPIHAMVEERLGKFFICDLGSQGGTYVKGEKIIDHALESGDEFQLGNITVEFHVGVPRAKGAAPAKPIEAPAKEKAPEKADKTAEALHHGHTSVKEVPAAPAAPPPKAKPVVPATPPVKATPAAHIPKEVPKKPKEAPKPLVEHSLGGGPVVTRSKEPYVGKGTFAPTGQYKLNEIVKPSKGNIVEVLVTWGDRVIGTKHFSQAQVISVGSNLDNQVVLPVFGSIRASHPLIRIEGGGATIYLAADMTGEVVRENGGALGFDELRRKGSIVPSGVGSAYVLQQNELVKVNVGEGVAIVIRYVASSPDIQLMPFIDLSVNQLTSIILGLMATAVFMFYAYLYSPAAQEKPEEEQEPPRKALFVYKHQATVPVEAEQQREAPKAAQTVKTEQPAAPAQGEEGASAEPKKTKNAQSKIAQKKAVTKNTTNANPGAAPKAPAPKDVSKVGLMGVFGSKGIQDQINKTAAAAGNVAGLSKNATGSASDGEGSGIGGSALRDTGANGNGTATVGISGVKTKGRGGGITGYGTGTLGAKKNASLIASDSEATFAPGIDKEAIRRVVQEHLKEIKACYEKGLNRNPSLYGKIVIRWTIGPGGRVTAAGIKNTSLDSPEVESCAVSRLRLWKFPEPPAGEEAEVSYPFIFQAQE